MVRYLSAARRRPHRGRRLLRLFLAIIVVIALGVSLGAIYAWGATGADLERSARAALDNLYATTPKAQELGSKARAVLVFPKIIKAGFMVGGQSGDGVLFEGGKATRYYNISAGSFGFQAGAQKFGYALFFISPQGLDYLEKSDGWAIGSGPSVVVLDKGKAKSVTSTTLSQDVYAMPFGQKGLMAGAGLEGSKITEIHPD
jgi:lipid-binding SYLF domain-containing protein